MNRTQALALRALRHGWSTGFRTVREYVHDHQDRNPGDLRPYLSESAIRDALTWLVQSGLAVRQGTAHRAYWTLTDAGEARRKVAEAEARQEIGGQP